ncbi:uroporphyrinogen-III C-methyltransferase [Calidifontibacter terrae]
MSKPNHPDLTDRDTFPGEVVLVGGGPGDPGLLTLAGMAALRAADVVVCDRLAPLAVLDELDADIVHVGKVPRGDFTPQDRINQLLVDHARAGRNVVRFKGGDNFVFGRGGEEWNACVEAGIRVRVVPGVSSALAAPALAGIPVTHRDLTQGFTVVSGHVRPGDPRSNVDWPNLAASNLTLVVLMGVATLDDIARELIDHGRPADTPAACIADAGLPTQHDVRGPLEKIAALATAAEIAPPAVTVIGAVTDALTIS